jgi:ABC-type dipeptide/oligopeptide/nickel transport system permease subunit
MTTTTPTTGGLTGAGVAKQGEPAPSATPAPAPTRWREALRSRRVLIGGGALLFILLLCVATLPWTLHGDPAVYAQSIAADVRTPPTLADHPRKWFGYDMLGRSIFARCLLGGVISLAVGVAAAVLAIVLGVSVGLIAGYRGGWIDSVLMRLVDILYGLPYILLIILFKIALEDPLRLFFARFMDGGKASITANLVVLFAAIGLVSWLTMARVVRGQVLSLRGQPFIEACRALGVRESRIFLRHILPNLVGPIMVYATLTVPSAILQESFLSFLGVGVNAPLPTWGSLASEGVAQMSPIKIHWWMIFFPCALLAITLLSLNFLGDGLRDVFDPKKEAAKI